jgi:branched-chain amino acid transport system substrate-binding protein
MIIRAQQFKSVAKASVLLGLAFCLVSCTSPILKERVIVKIGVGAPLTGSIGHLGRDIVNGATLAIEEINRSGLVIAQRDIELQLIPEDDGADPRQGAIVAQKLISSGVAAVIGHLNSGVSLSAARIYADANIPMISPSSSNPKLTALGYETVFRLVANDAMQGDALARFIVQDTNRKRILIVDDRSGYGEVIANGARSALGRFSEISIARISVGENEIDISGLKTALDQFQADGIIFGGMETQAAALLAALNSANSEVVFASADGACTPEFAASVRSFRNQKYCSQGDGVALYDPEKYALFKKKYQARFLTAPEVYGANAYDAVKLISVALASADPVHPNSLSKAIRKTDSDGIIGRISFDAHGDLVNGAISIYAVQEGKLLPRKIIR